MRIRIGIPALAIVLILAGDLLLLTQGDKSTTVSLEDAVAGFRAAAPDTPVGTAAPAGAPGAMSTTPTGPAPAGPVATTLTPTATGTAPASVTPFVPPAQGVYTYKTRGYEEVSLGGGRHDYPDRTYAALRHRSGCEWEVEHKVLEEHIERTIDCSAPGRLTHLGDNVQVTFFNQQTGETYHCDPPMVLAQTDDAPGTKRSTTCTGDGGGRAAVTLTVVGREKLSVGGIQVDALHVISDTVMSGRSKGTSRHEGWVHADTGLMLKSIRKIQTRAEAFGTTVDYREDASYELERLEPAR